MHLLKQSARVCVHCMCFLLTFTPTRHEHSIDVGDINYTDNKVLMDFFLQRRTGLFDILNQVQGLCWSSGRSLGEG